MFYTFINGEVVTNQPRASLLGLEGGTKGFSNQVNTLCHQPLVLAFNLFGENSQPASNVFVATEESEGKYNLQNKLLPVFYVGLVVGETFVPLIQRTGLSYRHMVLETINDLPQLTIRLGVDILRRLPRDAQYALHLSIHKFKGSGKLDKVIIYWEGTLKLR